MKYTYQNLYNRGIVLLSCLSILFSSCDYYNFSNPQPAGKENIYEFPKEFRGRWMEPRDSSLQAMEIMNSSKQRQGGPIIWQKDQTGLVHDGNVYLKNILAEEDTVWYLIKKNYALFIMHTREKIAIGGWPKIGDNGDLIYPPFYNSLKKIEYDSLRKPIDTLDKYLFRGDNIYEIGDERFLGKGYHYYFDKDTVVVIKNDTICVDLGQNAFLRRLDKNFYVLNIRNSILGEDNSWWRFMILEIRDENSFNIWECSSKTAKLPCMFYDEASKLDIFYFDCNWSSPEMLKLLHEGYFEMTSGVVRDETMKR